MQRSLHLLAFLPLPLLAGCGGGGGGDTQFVLVFASLPVNGTDGRTLGNVVVEVRNVAGVVETTIGGDTPDATIAGAFQLTFAPGETTKTISIPIVDDATAEVDETLIITIASARLATSIGANATHTLTITSNE